MARRGAEHSAAALRQAGRRPRRAPAGVPAPPAPARGLRQPPPVSLPAPACPRPAAPCLRPARPTCTTTMLPTAAAACAARGEGASPSGVIFSHLPFFTSNTCTSLVAPARRMPAAEGGGADAAGKQRSGPVLPLRRGRASTARRRAAEHRMRPAVRPAAAGGPRMRRDRARRAPHRAPRGCRAPAPRALRSCAGPAPRRAAPPAPSHLWPRIPDRMSCRPRSFATIPRARWPRLAWDGARGARCCAARRPRRAPAICPGLQKRPIPPLLTEQHQPVEVGHRGERMAAARPRRHALARQKGPRARHLRLHAHAGRLHLHPGVGDRSGAARKGRRPCGGRQARAPRIGLGDQGGRRPIPVCRAPRRPRGVGAT
jgi:hypothetical protein